MAKLILSMETTMLKEIPLNKERTTIGRKPHNDIQIDNLAISGEHAVVITILNDSFLEDLGSTNGTFVNGQSVKKHFLKNGDTIELGKYRLKYVAELPQQTGSADFEKTMILRPGATTSAPPAPAPQAAPPAAPTPAAAPPAAHTATSPGMAPHVAPTSTPAPAAAAMPLGAIQILSGGNAGKEMELVKTLTTLGKPGVQVAVIARRPHGYFITHVEGATFPVVNGAALGTQAHQLGDHDVIELAGTKMEFFLKG
ncbi:FHA domain-containing protein [Sulfuritalea sp.]|uniref:FHA domain-containing protein n=1 Tax=Sulfuritalea sp. TaxID=2480090 RepID=UPI001AD2351E|nr:FHA domain-containing protein [Sulfuritalea sp.]MBN8473488.1 FHA domain-containing protein [Sulfuritalea sp.]